MIYRKGRKDYLFINWISNRHLHLFGHKPVRAHDGAVGDLGAAVKHPRPRLALRPGERDVRGGAHVVQDDVHDLLEDKVRDLSINSRAFFSYRVRALRCSDPPRAPHRRGLRVRVGAVDRLPEEEAGAGVVQPEQTCVVLGYGRTVFSPNPLAPFNKLVRTGHVLRHAGCELTH